LGGCRRLFRVLDVEIVRGKRALRQKKPHPKEARVSGCDLAGVLFAAPYSLSFERMRSGSVPALQFQPTHFVLGNDCPSLVANFVIASSTFALGYCIPMSATERAPATENRDADISSWFVSCLVLRASYPWTRGYRHPGGHPFANPLRTTPVRLPRHPRCVRAACLRTSGPGLVLRFYGSDG